MDAFLEEQNRWRVETEASTRAFLQARKFREAAEAVAAYQAQQVFWVGINVNWSKPILTLDVAVLESLLLRVPEFIGPIDGGVLEQLRLAAGLYYLWSNPLEPFPAGFEVNHPIRKDLLAQNLWCAAKFQVELADLKETGFEWVEIHGANDSKVCLRCTELQSRRWRIDEVPELPYAKCTSEVGCRCGMSAWFGR